MKVKHVRYPIYDDERFFDRLALKVRYLPFWCLICNQPSLLKINGNNLREDCTCRYCKSFNRQRQVCSVLLDCFQTKKTFFSSISAIIKRDDISVYYTESKGPIHDVLAKMKNYTCSEYFGDEYKSGHIIDGVLHQDLQALSFADNSFDVVISSEVFEHIPDTYKAFKEVHRVLRPGGRHIFTIPFDARSYTDSVKAIQDENGKITYLSEPEYHEDPIRPESGVLVYRIFSLEMLIKLKELGFTTNMHHLYNSWLGILGNNALVFESIKE